MSVTPNKQGVFVNPDVRVFSCGRCSVYLKEACYNGEYYGGFEIRSRSFGRVSPCSTRNPFRSVDELRAHQIPDVLTKLQHERDGRWGRRSDIERRECLDVMGQLKIHIVACKQTSLFDAELT